MSLAIDLDKVTVKYGKKEALSNVSLHLDGGKIYGLLGRNGAGKTTLLSLLASFMEPTSGTVKVDGKPPFENGELMSRITFVYDQEYKDESEKVKGLLEAAERYWPNFDREYADHLVKLFGLPEEKQAKQLSRGQKSALNATIGLASRSPLTIFDEVYLGMDAPTRELFYHEVLEDHARHPRTMILSTHLVSETDYVFEEVVILHQGAILLHEPIDRLLERGVSVTGAAQEVDDFAQGKQVLGVQQLGGTKSVMLYGKLTEQEQADAAQRGLQLGPISLQDLFIHLTGGGNGHENQ